MERVYNSVCWMNYPPILHIPQKLLSIDFRLVYWELFHTLNHNRVKLHGIEQFPHLGSLTLPVLSNYGKPETPWSSAWLAVYADQRRRKVTLDQFLRPIYHYANCCNELSLHGKLWVVKNIMNGCGLAAFQWGAMVALGKQLGPVINEISGSDTEIYRAY